MKPKINISDPMRPHIPGYGISTEKEGLLSWKHVDKWMSESKNYWISTTNPNGKPHARPIWGVWLDDVLYVGGGSQTKSFRNLKTNPNITAHTESGDKTVIIEGIARLFENPEFAEEISSIYEEKYNQPHPLPFYGIIPQKVFAWTIEEYDQTPTKWLIDEV